MLNSYLDTLKQREEKRSFEYVALLDAIKPEYRYHFANDFVYVVEDTETKYRLTRHAFNQLCQILAKQGNQTISARHLWGNPDTLNYNMNYHIGQVVKHIQPEDDVFEVILNVHNGTDINGVLSKHYVGVSNLEVMEAFWDACQEQDMYPVNIELRHYDDYYDTMRATILFEQFVNDNNLYGAGVLILNSQNGKIGLTVQPIVKSTACDNSITMYTDKWYHRHTGSIQDELENAFHNLEQYVSISVNLYHAYHQMRQIIVPDMDHEIDKIIAQYKIPKKYRKYFVEGLTSEYDKQEHTMFGLVSGMTYLAQHLPDIAVEQKLIEDASRLIMNEMNKVEKAEAIGA